MNEYSDKKALVEPLLIPQETVAMMLGLNNNLFFSLKRQGKLPGLPEPIRLSKKIILYRTKDIKAYVDNLPAILAGLK